MGEDFEKEYVFRYPLQTDEAPTSRGGEPMYYDHLVEMLRLQLKNLLDLVIPVCGDRELKIDGFKLLRDRGRIYRIYSEEAGPENRSFFDDQAG